MPRDKSSRPEADVAPPVRAREAEPEACGKTFKSEAALAQHQRATGCLEQFECEACGKTCKSEAALAQHQRDTGHYEYEGKGKGKGTGKGKGKIKGKGNGKFECEACGKTCKSEAALAQHERDAGCLEQWTPDPPVDGPGEWVPTERFEGSKSFGYFSCGCGRSWVSAHTHRAYRQGCKGCEVESRPYLMWQNHDDGRTRERRDPEDSQAEHDRSRCEACRRGVCTAGLPFDTGRYAF